MTLVPIPWATQSPKALSGVASVEKLVNCYLDVNPANAKGPVTVYGDPGLRYWADVPEAPIRGCIMFDEAHLVVAAGENLYVVTPDKASAVIGAIPGSGPVHMCANATHVGIATSVGFYAATLASVSFVDANVYTSATYQDGYGILTLAQTEQIYITGLDDMTTIDPLDFTSADTFPDLVRGCISTRRELVVFGYNTIEHYYNSGDPYYPFSRVQGGFVEVGCSASMSIAKSSGVVFWLGNDGAVWALSGYQPKRLSTPGLEREIKAVPDTSNAVGFCYTLEGHENYVITVGGKTYAYDVTTGLWRDRTSFGRTRWRAEGYVQAFGKDLVWDDSTECLSELAVDEHTELGEPHVRTMVPPPVHSAGRRATMHQVFIDAEMGTRTVQQLDPELKTTPGTHAWTTPKSGKFRVECVGGGGAGGSGALFGGAGGGGGAYARSEIYLSVGRPISIVVGAGGVGASGADGTDGGQSSFGSLVVAAGGAGGDMDNTIGGTGGTGGVGGSVSACIGDVCFAGGDALDATDGQFGTGGGGAAGDDNNGFDSSGIPGGAASPPLGGAGGASGGDVDQPGYDGYSYGGGGGGSGAIDAFPSAEGGDGAGGIVQITDLGDTVPLFSLEFSDDGGKTWSNIRHISAGDTGEFSSRFVSHRMGSFRQRSLRVSYSYPSKMAVIGAYADIEVID